MSSTGRTGVRHPDDFYETPGWAIDAILPLVLPSSGLIIEPGAGNGAIVRRLIAAGVPAHDITAIELDPGRAEACRGTGCNVRERDFLALAAPEPRVSLALGNPPFSLALEFIEQARRHAVTVSLLLRLNFLGSQARAPWHRKNPSDVHILPRRPSFTEPLRWSAARGETRCPLFVKAEKPKAKPARCERAAGHEDLCMTIGTDSCEYAWFVWGPGRIGRWSILDLAPVAELDAPPLATGSTAGPLFDLGAAR